MRDLMPLAARRRRFVVDALRALFERFGFEPLDTPAIELSDTLLGKYGPEAERLVYRVGLGDELALALRYDLSVPLARVSAQYDDLPRPFRRYQIAPVWRGERPQRGRYREFYQADVDIVGSASLLADAEIVTLVVAVLDRLGFTNNLTKLNNRALLDAFGRYSGVPDALLPGLYRAIDKLDKVGLTGVRLELLGVGLPGELLNRQRQAVGQWCRGQADRARLERDLSAVVGDAAPTGLRAAAVTRFLDALAAWPNGGADDALVAEASGEVMAATINAQRQAVDADAVLPTSAVDRLLEVLQLTGESRAILDEIARRLDDPGAEVGVAKLRQVLDCLDAAGVPATKYAVDFTMVRGLDYYTGTIFETVVSEPAIGSITGGGRYDRLVAQFGRELPAVGTSFGVDRLVDVMAAAGLFPPAVDALPTQVLVARFGADPAPGTALAAELRAAGVATEAYLEADGLGNQIRYALKRGIPYVAIVGPDELEAGTVTLRDLARAEQAVVARDRLADEVGHGAAI
jgi:histidyl-tRNA synthetase